MGSSSSKNGGGQAKPVPVVEVTWCTVHEYVAARIQEHGDKVAQVDAATGETVTFAAILERSAALAAGLVARGLRPGATTLVIGENSVHYPWVLLGVLRAGGTAHLIDPRSTAREVEHAVGISKPSLALVSAAVSKERDVTRVLRNTVGSVLVWGANGDQGQDDQDLPEGIASLERLLVSPAKSAASVPCSPVSEAKTPTGPSAADGVHVEGASVLTVKDVLTPGLRIPVAPPPTPTSLSATYGDSCSPSSVTSPLQSILPTAVEGVPRADGKSVPQLQGGASVALILPSSGSTGLPKGVMISHDNLLAALELGPIFIKDKDVVAGLSPYFHAYGGVLMLMALCAGVPMVAISRFSMSALLGAVKEHKITVMHVVSSLLVSLGKLPVEALAELSSLERLWSGAAQVSPLVQSALHSRLPGVSLHHSYGMTETTFTTFCGEVRADKPGSPGTLVKAMECKVVDPESNKPLAMGARGELCFKGPMVTRGYLANAEATAEAFDADGWLRSGDLGYVDEDGYFYVVERLKDVLKYNGHQVSPSELEALLITHPAVCEAAVIGEPHEYGEAPRALVRVADGHRVTEEELCQFISGKVAPHKQLRGGITFMSVPFPRTASGKLQRKKLRALLQDADDSFNSSACSDPSSPTAAPAPVELPVAEQPQPASSVEAPAPEAPVPVQVTAAAPQDATPSERLIAAEAEVTAADRVAAETLEDALETLESVTGVAMSPEPQGEQQSRPSLASINTLSTIYSESPVSTPPSASIPYTPEDVFATPFAVARLKEAAQVPLPASEPNSPAGNLLNGSSCSIPADLASPLQAMNLLDDTQGTQGTPGSMGSALMDLVSPLESNIYDQSTATSPQS